MTVYLIYLVILEVLFMDITIMYAVLGGKQYFPIVTQAVIQFCQFCDWKLKGIFFFHFIVFAGQFSGLLGLLWSAKNISSLETKLI